MDPALWLRRELRIFVAGPGRAELRIARAIERGLRAEQVKVGLWPGYDTCDVLPDGLAWPADVKSWANPVRLARRLDKHPFRPPPDAEKAFIVIAREQVSGRPHYLRTVFRHCGWLQRTRHVEVVSEQTYVKRVIAEFSVIRRAVHTHSGMNVTVCPTVGKTARPCQSQLGVHRLHRSHVIVRFGGMIMAASTTVLADSRSGDRGR